MEELNSTVYKRRAFLGGAIQPSLFKVLCTIQFIYSEKKRS